MRSSIFFNPSSRTMALGFTQPLTEIISRRSSWGKAQPERKANNLTANWEPIVYKIWNPRHLSTL
jgi:hypothetical protein